MQARRLEFKSQYLCDKPDMSHTCLQPQHDSSLKQEDPGFVGLHLSKKKKNASCRPQITKWRVIKEHTQCPLMHMWCVHTPHSDICTYTKRHTKKVKISLNLFLSLSLVIILSERILSHCLVMYEMIFMCVRIPFVDTFIDLDWTDSFSTIQNNFIFITKTVLSTWDTEVTKRRKVCYIKTNHKTSTLYTFLII